MKPVWGQCHEGKSKKRICKHRPERSEVGGHETVWGRAFKADATSIKGVVQKQIELKEVFNTYRTLYPQTSEHKFFSSTHSINRN